MVAVLPAALRGNREFVRAHPIATCAPSAKLPDICAADPEQAEQQLVDAGFTGRYEYALQMLNEVPCDHWREYDTEDTLRFYALRLHEADMITSHPNQIIPRAPTGGSSASSSAS